MNLTRKIQKNASPIIEFVVSFSHEFSDGWETNSEKKMEIDTYFNNSETFLKARYGNVLISRADHFDEKTPHSHFLLVPICVNKQGNRKFSSSEFLGGKKGLFDLHDQFHKQVGSQFGLERGVRDSRTKHFGLKNYDDWEKGQRIIIEQKETALNEQEDFLREKETELTRNEDLLRDQKERIEEDRETLNEQQSEIVLVKKRLETQKSEVAQEKKLIEKQQNQITQEKVYLEKQQEENEKKKREIEAQKKQLSIFIGKSMEKSVKLKNREMDLEKIEEDINKQTPQIPIPPAVAMENTRKTWRDNVQRTVDMAFKKLKSVVLSFKVKYDDLLEKYQNLIVLNKIHKKRAENAERDLLQKPIEEIIKSRKQKIQAVPVKEKKDEHKRHKI